MSTQVENRTGADNTAPVEEVELEQAKTEDTKSDEDVVDVLVPKSKVVKWEIGPANMKREYVQRELSFVKKMQWFALVGEVVDEALSGDNALTLGNLLSAPGSRDGLSIDDFRDADTFVQAVGKLLVKAPDFLLRSYCIWLNVPDYEYDLAQELMALPPEQGGLSDKQGIEIIETFIDQNYEALDRFFREEVGRLGRRIQQRASKSDTSRK